MTGPLNAYPFDNLLNVSNRQLVSNCLANVLESKVSRDINRSQCDPVTGVKSASASGAAVSTIFYGNCDIPPGMALVTPK